MSQESMSQESLRRLLPGGIYIDSSGRVQVPEPKKPLTRLNKPLTRLNKPVSKLYLSSSLKPNSYSKMDRVVSKTLSDELVDFPEEWVDVENLPVEMVEEVVEELKKELPQRLPEQLPITFPEAGCSCPACCAALRRIVELG